RHRRPAPARAPGAGATRARARAQRVRGRRTGRPLLLGCEALDLPAATFPRVAEAVVQAALAMLPELVGVGNDPDPAPRLRKRNGQTLVLALQLGDTPLELVAAAEHAALP